jgi:hypothetical protein
MNQSLGQKNDRRCGPQFGPDQRVQRGGHFEEMKRGRTAYHQDGFRIVEKVPSG